MQTTVSTSTFGSMSGIVAVILVAVLAIAVTTWHGIASALSVARDRAQGDQWK